MKIYEGEHHRRSIVSYPPDCHAARALKLRKSLPRLEMPCVRAATSSIGVRLDRLRVPRPIRRKIFALAFDLPDEEERLAEKRRDELTIKSKCRRQTNICVGGDVRFEGCKSDESYYTGELSLPPVERTFTAPRMSPSVSPMGDLSSDDEDIDEAVLADSDDEDDVSAELICRPRTIGGVAQPRE